MDTQLILSLANYFKVQSIALCADQISDKNVWNLATFSETMYVSGCGTFKDYEMESNDMSSLQRLLLVCENNKDCNEVFDKVMFSSARKGMIFLLTDGDFSLNSLSNLRYFDTILLLEKATGVISESYGFNSYAFKIPFGMWNMTSKTLSVPEKSKWERRSDMHGQVIRTTILHWYPMAIKTTKESEDNSSTWGGFIVNLLEGLKSKLNFTIEYTSPADGTWGVKVDTRLVTIHNPYRLHN